MLFDYEYFINMNMVYYIADLIYVRILFSYFKMFIDRRSIPKSDIRINQIIIVCFWMSVTWENENYFKSLVSILSYRIKINFVEHVRLDFPCIQIHEDCFSNYDLIILRRSIAACYAAIYNIDNIIIHCYGNTMYITLW
jgi:hypothetical protein